MRVLLAIVLMLASGAAHAADDAVRAWDALRGDGHIALIRHAAAPGAPGDPAGFKLDDCKTQRNLSDEGRAQARALGERFRKQKVKVGKVISSQWCRCKETAVLMGVGAIEEAPTFNNAFRGGGPRDKLTAGARAVIAAWRGPGTLVVATHGQNVLGLLGFRPQEGEVVVVKPVPASETKMRVVGRIPPS